MKRGIAIASFLLYLSTVAVVAGCSDSDDPPESPAAQTPSNPGTPQLTQTVFKDGLSNPWDLAFAPDGAMFYTERCSGLSVRRTDGTTQRLFGTSGSATVATDLVCEGQSGMNGVAVDPDYANNHFVFVYMTSTLSTPDTNRVVRLIVDTGYTTVTGRVDIIDNIPFKAAANGVGGAGAHSGGRLRFSPSDGFLYVTTGDNHNGTLPQDLTLLGGKVLRIDRNGVAATGNNTPMGGNPRIYTYGHRNVQGIAFRPGSLQPFSCEHGPGHTDEVTPLIAGANSGWDPAPQPGVTNCPSNYCGYMSNRPDGALTRMTDVERFPNAMRPSWTNNGNSAGMGPCAFLNGTQWKDWEGRLLVGVMGAGVAQLLTLDANGMTTSTQVVSLPSARIRSIVPGPDGALYIATDAGQIWRVTGS